MKSLTDPLPLRTTAEWPGFREAAPLPVRIGRTRGPLIQYDQARLQFCWAGHACQGIDQVFVGGLAVQDWRFDNIIDAAGKAIALVTFASPLPEGAEASASGRGLMDAAGGFLLENPADVILAIANDIAGLGFSRERLAPFRKDCIDSAILLGGSIEQADSTQTVLRSIAASIGAKFSPAARTLAFLWPSSASATIRATITDNGPTVSRSMTVSDFCNDLTIQYDFDSDQPRGSMRLVCPAQIARYGAFPQTLAATWITSAGVAQRVGARMLSQSARKQWLVTAEGVKSDIRIGDAVAFQHALMTAAGSYPVLSRTRTDAKTSTITARIPIGGIPAVSIASQSSYYDPNAYVSAEVETQGTDWVFTIVDSDGVTPLANAAVSLLPSGPTKQTDGSGRVSFTAAQMPAGHTYTLGVTTADGRYFTFGVSV